MASLLLAGGRRLVFLFRCKDVYICAWNQIEGARFRGDGLTSLSYPIPSSLLTPLASAPDDPVRAEQIALCQNEVWRVDLETAEVRRSRASLVPKRNYSSTGIDTLQPSTRHLHAFRDRPAFRKCRDFCRTFNKK